MKTVELGCPGHFIAVESCRFRRHTQIGNRYRVSTVGDYFPPPRDARKTVGAGAKDFFETMVFETVAKLDANNDGCGCRTVKDYGGLEQTRYATAGEAQKGHERFVKKYAKRASRPSRRNSGE